MNKIKRQKGFTLIELLVVIAIIGILAAIVLVNVNSARNKAKDAAIKANFAVIPAAAENIYDTATATDGYTNVFASGSEPSKAITAALTQTTVAVGIDDVLGWCACAQLVVKPSTTTTNYYCIDSAGHKNTTLDVTCATDCVSGDVVCDGA